MYKAGILFGVFFDDWFHLKAVRDEKWNNNSINNKVKEVSAYLRVIFFTCGNWWTGGDLNPGPSACKADVNTSLHYRPSCYWWGPPWGYSRSQVCILWTLWTPPTGSTGQYAARIRGRKFLARPLRYGGHRSLKFHNPLIEISCFFWHKRFYKFEYLLKGFHSLISKFE